MSPQGEGIGSPRSYYAPIELEGPHYPARALSRISLTKYKTDWGIITASVDDIWELHGVLNEENRNVIPNNIPVSLLRVELHSKTSYISHGIRTPPRSKHSRETQKNGRGARGISEHTGMGDIFSTLIELEGTESSRASSVDDSFWNTLVVELHDLEDVSYAELSDGSTAYLLSSKVILEELRTFAITC